VFIVLLFLCVLEICWRVMFHKCNWLASTWFYGVWRFLG